MSSSLDRRGYALIAGLGVLAVAILAFKMSADRKPKPDARNCVGQPQESTVIVFDRSEDVSGQTIEEMKARAASYIRDSVGANALVSVFTVDDSSSYALRPLVSLCRPRSDGNRLVENVHSLQLQYVANFQGPIDSVLNRIEGQGKRSPIAQTLTDISLSQYLGARKNTLLVFSDLLENTERFSLYHCSSPQAVIQNFRASRTGARERPSFKNTRVYLNVIPRLDYPASVWRCRDTLWPWFFGDDSGPNAGLETSFLPGGPPPRTH